MKRLVLLGATVCVLLTIPARAAKHETWVEVRSPNFIVVSNAGEKQARKTAAQFEQIRSLFRSSLAAAAGHPTPVITIFAVKDEKSLSELLPEYWAKGHSHPAGWFAYRMEQFYIAVNLEAQGSNPFKTVYHEYYHSLTMPFFPNMPTWLSEGLADFFGNSEISGSAATMGRPDPNLIELLRQNKLIPLDVLLKVDHNSPYYNEQNKTSLFYAESWALTHYLFIGDNQSHRASLIAFADSLSRGKSSDEAAAIAFGDLKKLQSALENYVGKYSFNYYQVKAPSELPASEIRIRTLSDAEVGAYRGGFFAIRGALGDAIISLQDAVRLDPSFALAYRNLALAQFFKGERVDALVSATKAIELDPENGLAHYLRAYLSVSGKVKLPDDSQVEADLDKAIEQDPYFAAPFALLSWYLVARNEKLGEALALAQKANELEPGNVSYQIDLAQALMHMRRFDDAYTFAVRAQAAASGPDRARVENFLSQLEQFRERDAREDANGGVVLMGRSQADTKEVDQGDLETVTGVVSVVSCTQGLKVQMATSNGNWLFHVEPSAQFHILLPEKLSQKFNPCTDLIGKRVSVKYAPDASMVMAGKMSELRILPQSKSSETTQAGGEVGNRSPSTRPQKASPTPTISEEGKVKSVTCNGHEMNISLVVRDIEFDLHARDYSRVPIQQDIPFAGGQFDPCRQLIGLKAKVEYVMVEGKDFDGEIQSIEVEK
ncbi:MAG: DUF1570 domain-containing protein [Candidatus Acidiferrales bacterium]